MARGPIAAAGGLYEADLVFDALASIGVEIAEIGCALDFGCSSGRVVRVLQAAYPDTRWHGCDPNAPAVAWASENLPAVELFVNAAAAAGRRLARHGLRNLDLVALRARARPALVR
jgi:methylase of polypeptide subunit release factors